MYYKWLHVSDLHSICSGIRTVVMRDALIDEIEYINKQSPFSFLLITGDISNKNEGYNEAKALIQRIIKASGVALNKVFIVPGNHDVNRQIPEDRCEIIKRCWETDILDENEETTIEKLIQGQETFFSIYEDILGRKYPVEKVHYYDVVDQNLAIIHLNTSWMCYDSDYESGKLHIGLKNAYKCISEESLKDKPIKIAIGHHRMSDFNKNVENHLKQIFKIHDIDLYLGGHCHESSVIYDPTINTEFCSCRQAHADDKDYPAGFIVGVIDTETDQSSFQFYNWDNILAKWTYDYTVNPAKHGKYYLQGTKFTREPENNRNIIVDLKSFGLPLDIELIMKEFSLTNSAVYSSSLRDMRPISIEEWEACIYDIYHLYESIVKNSIRQIHIFPMELIPVLVSFGYLIQNSNPNIYIYQYFENEERWVYDETDDQIPIFVEYNNDDNDKLAVAVSLSGNVEICDINQVIDKFDLLSVHIEEPIPSKLNYKADVQRVKRKLKTELDRIYSKYNEIHLFLAAPAGLCIEIGRIIRENMYPDTYVYFYQKTAAPKYKKIINLKDIRKI